MHCRLYSSALSRYNIDMLGARRVYTRFHDHRLDVPEENAQRVIEKDTLEGDLNVN